MAMNKAGKVVPISDNNPPAVSSATGLGTGGGAGIGPAVGSGWGAILLKIGSNPLAAGNVVLKFASIPPTLTFAADDHFGTITVSGQGTTTITVSWTTAQFHPGEIARLDFEWTTSQ